MCLEPDSGISFGLLEQTINRAIGRLEDLRDDPPAAPERTTLQKLSPGVGSGAALGGLIATGLAYWFGWVG